MELSKYVHLYGIQVNAKVQNFCNQRYLIIQTGSDIDIIHIFERLYLNIDDDFT